MSGAGFQTTRVGVGVGFAATVAFNLLFGWIWWLVAVGDAFLTDPVFLRWFWPVLALGAFQLGLAGALYGQARWRRAGVGVLVGVGISAVLDFVGVFAFLILTQS